MKLTELNTLIESRRYLYEGLNADALHTVKLWESAGRQLREAELTADQIQQIFAQAEQGATAAGGNRTLIGQGKDAAVAINKAWEDLKTKVSTSGPVKGVDAMYDTAVQKIEAGLGGPDNAVNQAIQKYRTFAKEHPIAQSLIYSALIAAAGITGAGLGGAAVLGLFKMVDKLLQGEKFSSAAYSGAKTGAMAFGASKIGDMIKGAQQAADYGSEEILPVVGQQAADAAAGAAQGAADVASNTIQNVAGAGMNALKDPAVMNSLASAAKAGGKEAFMQQINQVAPAISQNAKELMYTQALKKAGMAAESYVDYKKTLYHRSLNEALGDNTNVLHLTEAGVQHVFQLAEGPMDWIKQKAGQAANAVKNKLSTVGKNLTTKVTADKLNSAWAKAGSPTDSEQVKQIMQGAGVTPDVIAQIYKTAGIPDTAAAAPQATALQAAPQAQVAPQATAQQRAPQAAAQATTAGEEPFSVADAAGQGIANTLSGASDAIERGRNAYIGGSVADQTHPNKGNGLEIADRTGKRTKYIQSGDKWFTQDGTEVDPAMAAMLKDRAAQQATTGAAAKPTTAPATTPTTAPATTPTTTPVTGTATTPTTPATAPTTAPATPNTTATAPTTAPATPNTTATATPATTPAADKPATATPNFGQKGVMPGKVTYDPKMLAKPGAKPAASATPTTAPNFNTLSTTMNKPLTIAKPTTTAPAATAPKDARFPNGKYDAVTGQATPEWQAELDKQDADAKAKAAALPQLGAPPATTTPAPTATAQADIGKPGFLQSKLQNQTVPAAPAATPTTTAAPAATAPATDADMDAAEQALLAKMQAKNPKLAPVAESTVDFGAMLFKRMKSGR